MGHDSEDHYIPTLDGWRAIAISLLLLTHSSRRSSLAEHLGFLGVAVFFGISGYLICTKLLVERERTQRISYSIYLWQMPFFSQRGWLSVHTRFLPLKIVVILGLAALSYYAIERPMIKLARRRKRKESPAVISPTPDVQAA